jgi:hypothetical protein
VPTGLPLPAPARLRALAPVRAGALTPVPRIWVMPGREAPVTVQAPGGVRIRIRPAELRVRLRLAANAPVQVLPGGQPRSLQLVVPGSRAVQVLPAVTPARLRIAFQKGKPVPARLVLPARLPGRARLRIQIPARARISPAQAAPPSC